MKNLFLTTVVLALSTFSIAQQPSTNQHSSADVDAAQPATTPTFTVLHEFKGSPDGAFPMAGVIQDTAGNIYGTTSGGGAAGEGTVYKLNTSGDERVLFSFSTANGSLPSSGLLRDNAGNFYGTAMEGPGGAGVLFRVSSDGTEEVLHAFQGGQGTEAAVPAGGVISDGAGNLFGATLLGGLGPFPGFGTLYRVDPTGKFSVLYKFQGKSDGAEPSGPLVRDAKGNLYGVALLGGDPGKGTVFKLSATGTLTVLHTFSGIADGSAPQGGLLLDKVGTLYGSTSQGGDSGNGTLFQIKKNGRFKRLYSFTGGPDGALPNGGLVQDPSGNLYGTTQIGPGQDFLGTVFQLSRARVLTVLHSFTGDADGAVPFAGLFRDNAGNLYGTAFKNFLVDQQEGNVFKIMP